jgi:protein-S-isoprenylcysteine O-methyltransferase Ste14
MNSHKILPTTWLLIAMLAILALHFLLPVSTIVPPLWNLLGPIPIALGVVLSLVADGAFHRAGTTVKPFEESSSLVTTGAFGLTRNPMYLGFALILAGEAIVLRSLSPYVVVIAFVVLMQTMYITAEERMLAKKFGPAWQAYTRKTGRWI